MTHERIGKSVDNSLSDLAKSNSAEDRDPVVRAIASKRMLRLRLLTASSMALVVSFLFLLRSCGNCTEPRIDRPDVDSKK